MKSVSCYFFYLAFMKALIIWIFSVSHFQSWIHSYFSTIFENVKKHIGNKLVSIFFRFLMNNFVEVSKGSKEFLELPLDDALKLLNSDRINVKNEEQVWEAGLRWIDHRPEERKAYIGRIIRCVRLGLLDNQYFMDKVKVHE